MSDRIVDARVAAIRKYLNDLPPRRGGRVEFADRIAESIGVSRTQFYALVRTWTRTGDASLLGATSGVTPGSVRCRTALPDDVARIMDEEIAAATDDVTDVAVRKRIGARLPDGVPPALPTIAKRRARGSTSTLVDRTEEVVVQTLRLSDALQRGVADLSARQATRAARHLGRHLGATTVMVGCGEPAIHGENAIRRRLRDSRTDVPLLVVVTGAKGRRDTGARSVKSMLQDGDHFAVTR